MQALEILKLVLISILTLLNFLIQHNFHKIFTASNVVSNAPFVMFRADYYTAMDDQFMTQPSSRAFSHPQPSSMLPSESRQASVGGFGSDREPTTPISMLCSQFPPLERT